MDPLLASYFIPNCISLYGMEKCIVRLQYDSTNCPYGKGSAMLINFLFHYQRSKQFHVFWYVNYSVNFCAVFLILLRY